MITRNIGGVETAIRAVLGSLVMVLAAVVAEQHPFVAIGMGLVATVILATAIAGVCPLYTALDIHTRPRWEPQRRTATKHEVGWEPPEGVPVRVLCPSTGGAAVVRLAISVAQPACVVVGCERFPDGALECNRECFPLDLARRRPFASATLG